MSNETLDVYSVRAIKSDLQRLERRLDRIDGWIDDQRRRQDRLWLVGSAVFAAVSMVALIVVAGVTGGL